MYLSRKKTQRALKLSEEQFRRAIEDAPIPTIMQAEDGQVLLLSRTWTELTGYHINDVPDFDTWLTKTVYGEGANAVRDYMHALFDGRAKSIDVEFPIRAVDGKVRYWTFSASSPGTLMDGRRFIVGMAVDITERKRAESALKESLDKEHFLAELVRNASIAVGVGYPDGRLGMVNEAFTKLTGYSDKELQSKTWNTMLTPPEYWEFEKKKLVKLHATKKPITYEKEYIRKDGSRVPVELVVHPFFDKEGFVSHYFSFITDITERKKAEEMLVESERRYHGLFSNMIDGFAYCEMLFDHQGLPVDFIYLDINPAFERLTGLEKGKVVGRKVSEAIPGTREANPEIFEIYGRVATTGVAERFELFFKPLGIWLYIVVYSPKKGYFVAAFENITERKKAEEKLRSVNIELEERVQQRTAQVSAERQRLYNVLETLPAYVVLLDRDYRVPFANKVFRERFGESHGRRCHEYLFNKEHECENCITYRVYRENKPQHWYWTGPDGRDYDIYDFPFKEADGSKLILEMGIDITERKKAEAQALESAKKLQEAQRLAAIGATAGMVGHDIRNPLQAIISDVFLAKSELEALPESEQKKMALESIEEIGKNTEYINKIVQDLQDFARPLNPKIEESDLHQIIDAVIKKNNSIPSNIKIKVQIADDAQKIKADPYYINRILYNLTTNSIQAMPDGGKITIRATKDAEDTILSVADTGLGISKESQEKMFTLMFTTKAKGQGFGLPVVKRMTESLGGTVSFISQEGKGTTFTVRLPPQRAKR